MSFPSFFQELCIEGEMQGKLSPLELLSQYLDEIRGSTESQPEALQKLGALFERGRTPERLEGHFYGVTLGIRTVDIEEAFGERANLLNLLWGSLLASHPPWVGKGFTPATAHPRR